jgi:glycerol-3-phosphate acyltransferase PlsY
MGLAITFLILSYLLGSIPFGLIIGKAAGKDLRKNGSGNIGSTNAIRILGVKLGLLAAVCDILKGTLVIIIIYILEATNVWFNPFVIESTGDSLYALYGLMAVIGHCYSIFLKFKGGKAVATSLGVLFATVPLAGVMALVAFFPVVFITRYVSLSSTAATIAAVLTSFIFYGVIIGDRLYTSFIVLILGLIIFIKHIPNYKRLANGTENRFGSKKKIA